MCLVMNCCTLEEKAQAWGPRVSKVRTRSCCRLHPFSPGSNPLASHGLKDCIFDVRLQSRDKLANMTASATLQSLAEAGAAAYLAREPLEQAEAALLEHLWPSISAVSVSTRDAPAQSSAMDAQQQLSLYQRGQPLPGCSVTVPMPCEPGMPSGSCTFQLTQPTAESAPLLAELRQFVQLLQSSIAHQSKVVMEVRRGGGGEGSQVRGS